jgi:hypothetical protein
MKNKKAEKPEENRPKSHKNKETEKPEKTIIRNEKTRKIEKNNKTSNGPARVEEYRREGVRVNLQIVTTGAE